MFTLYLEESAAKQDATTNQISRLQIMITSFMISYVTHIHNAALKVE